jgi:hypothetical protein
MVFGGCHPRGKSLKYDRFIKSYPLRLVLHFHGRLFWRFNVPSRVSFFVWTIGERENS